MSTAADDYQERLEDLFDDMESDGVDSAQMLMSAVASYVEGALEASGGNTYIHQFEDMNLIIIIQPPNDVPEQITSERIH